MSMLDRKERILNLLEANPEDDFLLYALAKEFENEKQMDESILTFQKLLKIHPNYIGAYYHLAKALVSNQKKTEGILVIKDGIERAKALKDLHALSELQSLLNEIQMEDLI
ncbi:MAG: hypothetical protein JNL65_06850 [Saprospiraceae bacterium]|nr:hypothetical protein [Saprospiraceae bacterium]HRG68644.1 hypothetical protein [Saprospiraceae bacterium]